jgi:hypothetical protein
MQKPRKLVDSEKRRRKGDIVRKVGKTGVDIQRGVCYTSSNDWQESAESPASGACPSADFQGPPKSESKYMRTDLAKIEPYKLHWLYNETRRQLERYATRAEEQVDVQAAVDFARWVQMSGLIGLFKDHPQPEPWPVDGQALDELVRTIIMDCGDFLKGNTPGFVRVCQIEAVNRKLDLIAGQMAKLSPPSEETATAGTTAIAPPALLVIQGGGQ